MREFLQSGQVGNIELNEQKKIRKQINERWENLGMLDGLTGVIKENIATLFENQAKSLLESTSSDSSGSFETVVFPIIRRVFSKLLANDIVSVQAMNLPIGKLFYVIPVTSNREWDFERDFDPETGMPKDGAVGRHTALMGYERTDRRNGNKYNRFYLPDDVIGNMTFEKFENDEWVALTGATNYDEALIVANGAPVRQAAPSVTKYYEKSLYDLFYNDFLFDNSRGKVRIRVSDKVNPVTFERGRIADKEWATSGKVDYVRTYNDGTIRNIMLKIKGFESYHPGKLTGPDGNEMDTETFLASLKVFTTQDIVEGTDETSASTHSATFKAFESIPFRVVTQKYGNGIVEYGDVCDADGSILIDLDLAKPSSVQGATLDGYIGIDPTVYETIAANASGSDIPFKATWAQYDSLELETEIGEVSFNLSSVTVSVAPRKLRATWSPELAQDVSAFHNIDAEAELTSLLSEQIAAEIDREILRDLRKFGPWRLRWDANGWRRMAGFSTNYTQKDWNQELITKINQISAQIQKATLRGGANFIVVSSEISALFNNLEYFHVTDASAESDQYNMGIERIGSLQNRYQVYVDPYSPAWSIIVGHKGKSLLDTGYIYAPYIPLQLTPTIYNPENFAPVKGIMTRYATKCVNGRFYGSVQVDGLQTFDPRELR